jgi:hypothetical protein
LISVVLLPAPFDRTGEIVAGERDVRDKSWCNFRGAAILMCCDLRQPMG